MGAGASAEQIQDHRRYVLKRAAQEYGGRYVPGHQSFVSGLHGWNLTTRVIRASNAETAFLFKVTAPEGTGFKSSKEYVTPDEAFAELKITKL